MQFKHPEILYFLFLLVIPILVHLFQLRRFKKEFFTNVKFLKELSIQTRKSSKIKKWLLLATRLLLLAFLIFAFAQPFFKAKDSENTNNELFIVLDNSYSMQAKGQKGELLKRAVQDLLEFTSQNSNFSIITNDENYWNTNINATEKDLQNLKYSAIPFSLETALTKIKSRKTFVNKDIVIITDAIGMNKNHIKNNDKNNKTYFIIPEAEQLKNIAIDSVYLAQTLDDFYEISVQFSSNFEEKKAIPVSVYNQKNLIAKTILNLKKNKETINFTIPKADFNGYVNINDNSLAFDNTLYFSISEPKITNVLSIGVTEKSDFLSRIYTKPEFNYSNSLISTLDYSQLNKQDAVVLNELDNIPVALQTNLKSFVTKGGNVILIPSEKNEISNLNSFLNNFGGIQFSNFQNQEKKITKINFSNPLFSNVFEKKITNFQYPNTLQSFVIKSNASQAITYDDQSAFLTSIQKQTGTVFVFSAPINKTNSNFQNSPLIVPTFYKMAMNTDKNGVKYETIGNTNPFLITANTTNNEVISIKNPSEEFIPSQQIMSDKIKISCADNPTLAGNFEVIQSKKNIGNISFNFDRNESNLTLPSDETLADLNVISNIESFFETIQINRTDSQVWKWFLIFALLFLLLELFIQKFVK
ncbi:N-terminal double-transmembrane domain-containing protein [Flavobacterium swingsii]|uniref:N-terminal double-transmembrane domain-containing protein n=1 Tax=Flavobacterium swingsii TaxID=498292 RepID=A0A1I0ZFY7_9FLAO|nr:BatA and WFA domain-containing protein [Flavobacterium swingsii]SFB24046.1 N-terminal double-transmembrane domain-containing protein [Flavobacterium swingsii]